jgi:hypothetical protein
MDDEAAWTSARLVAVDVEGNGQQPPRLVELAVVPIDAGVIGDPVSWLVRPPSPITWQATKVHGITDQDVVELPGIAAVEADIREYLNGAVWGSPRGSDTLSPDSGLGEGCPGATSVEVPRAVPPGRGRVGPLVTGSVAA